MIEYNRPVGRRQYVSIDKHLFNARNRFSKWLSVQIERNTFDSADYGNITHTIGNNPWEDSNGHLWGFVDNFEKVGTEKQQFGFFPKPANQIDRWHGYPIVPFKETKYNIEKQLIERWVSEGYLDADDVPDLLTRKKIK